MQNWRYCIDAVTWREPSSEPLTIDLLAESAAPRVGGGSKEKIAVRLRLALISTPYNPQLANLLLDCFGCKKGADGFRTLPDGKPLVLQIHAAPHARDQTKFLGRLDVSGCGQALMPAQRHA